MNPLALSELDARGAAFRPLDKKIRFRTLALQAASVPLSLPAQAFMAHARRILAAAAKEAGS